MSSTTRPATGATPIGASNSALHWAGVAMGLAEARTEQGNPLTDNERATYDDYQSAARAHGFTEQQVRDYAAALDRHTA